MLMRRNFPILLLMVAIIWFAAAGPLAAAEAPNWQLTLRDDGTIAERVALPAGASIQDDGWQVLSAGDQVVVERTVKNWAAYMELKDRLPLQVVKKNYFLWQDVEINKNMAVQPAGVAEALLAQDKGKILFRVPGIINANAGKQLSEDQVEVTAVAVNQLGDGGSLLQATTFNGLMMGIVLFVLGFLVVVIVFMNRIRKVNQMIEEEYSLERAAQQLEEEENGQQATEDKKEE